MKQEQKVSATYTGDILQNYFTAYVKRALQNNRITYYHKQARIHRTEQLSDRMEAFPNRNPSDDLFKNEQLLAALHQLSDKDLTLIRLHALQGYSYKSISAMLGQTPNALRVRYCRAIAKLRKRLEGSK